MWDVGSVRTRVPDARDAESNESQRNFECGPIVVVASFASFAIAILPHRAAAGTTDFCGGDRAILLAVSVKSASVAIDIERGEGREAIMVAAVVGDNLNICMPGADCRAGADGAAVVR